MIAIVTGSSKGIGKAIVVEFAKAGYDIIMCARDEKVLTSAAAEISKQFPDVTISHKAADLSNKSEVVQFAEWCLSKGVPDILVNNAGSYLPGNISDEKDGNLELLMKTNVYSAYYLTRALLPHMKEKSKGHIFNICSIASLHAYEGGGSYSISKFALNGFNKNLRHELMKNGIKVTAIFPGAVFTDSWKGFDNSMGRIMEAKDIAVMVEAASRLSPQANVEEIIIRPLEGDL
ncbi:MAG: SDR family oxidoreductase [Ferruginibacter sp.]